MSLDCAAEEIADELLFETGRALTLGDFDRFAACFGLPHVIETPGTRTVIPDLDSLHTTFDDLRRYYHDTQVIDVVRTVVKARFLNADMVTSTHVASLVHADGGAWRKLYPVHSVIRRQGDLDWRIMSSVYVIDDCAAHSAVLTPAPRQPDVVR